MSKWTKFKGIPKDSEGLWLVLTSEGIRLGSFYCGEFVQGGYLYNDTPGVVDAITQIQKVTPPKVKGLSK